MATHPDPGDETLFPGDPPASNSVSDTNATASEFEGAEPKTTSSEAAVEDAPFSYGLGSSGEEPPPPSGGDGGGNDGGGSGGGGGESGGDEPEPPEMARMSFFDHLEELRSRLFHSIIAIAVGMAVCWTYADNIYAGLARPLTTVLRELKMDDKLVYTNPTAPFNLYIRLAMIAGVFLASPYLIYQIWKFISPGLYRHEKRYALPFILFCTVLFLSGGAFAYFIAFPAALRFLLSFGSQFRPFITVDEYFSLASTIILGLAIVFELPVLVLFLTLLRIVTPGFLLRNFRYAFLIIVIIAAAATPTSDVVNMMIFAAPLMGLYFLGVGLSYLVLKARRRKAAM
jgi:sec-independent protein translocase protein TatC